MANAGTVQSLLEGAAERSTEARGKKLEERKKEEVKKRDCRE